MVFFFIDIFDLKLQMFYIYNLFSETSNLFYTGYTADVARRLVEHNETSVNTFTSKHRPWNLVGLFEVKGNESDAIKFEKFIKRQKSKIFIEKILKEDTILEGILAQLIRVLKLRD